MNIKELFNKLSVIDERYTSRKQIIEYLKDNGFKIKEKYPVKYFRSNGRLVNGSLTIYATKDNKTYGIEVDNRSARKSSMMKLKMLTLDYKVILVFDPEKYEKINNVEVIGLKTYIPNEYSLV